MDTYTIISSIFACIVFFAYVNQLFFKLPFTIAIMISSLVCSGLVIFFKHTPLAPQAKEVSAVISAINFHALLLNGMLSVLLFAGAMTLDFARIKAQLTEISLLAFVGTVLSTVIIAVGCYYLIPLLGFHLPLIDSFLFGALISPTDPIAVIATFKNLNAPREITTILCGESLFNDGIAIVIFLTLYQLNFEHHAITFFSVTSLFIQKALGGMLFGSIMGYGANKLILKSSQTIATLITLTMVTAGYAIANNFHLSGPLAMVVAGVFIGNTAHTRTEHLIVRELKTFWEILDELFNSVLFLLLGFELIIVPIHLSHLLACALLIALTLIARLISVIIPLNFIRMKSSSPTRNIKILTWGGLRGGLAIALALSLPPSHEQKLILVFTFAIVIFSIIAQGLTVSRLLPQTKAS